MMLKIGIGFLFAIALAGSGLAQNPILSSEKVCHFYGEANVPPAHNSDESCTIPNVDALDMGFHQGDFVCCGGGAGADTTNANIPPGLELKVTGGHYWSAYNPKLTGSTFTMHIYCGPNIGQPCNVSVDVIAHYRTVVEAKAVPNPSSSPAPVEQTHPTAVPGDKLGLDKTLAFVFGVVFVIVLLLVALFDRNPTPLAIFIYRVVLALAAGGIGAVLPGVIDVDVHPAIRAGGALALFVIVYAVKPADLIANNPPAEKP